MPDLTHLRKVAEAYTSGPSAAAEATRVAFERTFDAPTVRALLNVVEAAARLEKSAVRYMGQSHFQVVRNRLDEVKAALSRLEKEAGR
jgi:hypothetical protein